MISSLDTTKLFETDELTHGMHLFNEYTECYKK